ncbi:MAG TPA: hypothetical protein ENN29_07585 [Candidatus Hydrogenedentes bacterium]|nr:hypothetical protein [Candidatus Hydrogenedentota bacterium]
MLPAGTAYAETFKAGAAKRVITPDPLLPVSGGVGTPEPVTERKGDLFARALVMETGETLVALVSIDNLGWPKFWGDKTRALVPRIPGENILISATHCHSAPDAYCFRDMKGRHHADLDYLQWACEEMADAINEAIDNLQPAALKISVGEAKGKIAYNYYAPQLYDPRCSVLQAVDAGDASVLATLVNYAVHPEVLGPGRGILSPDLCGPLYDRIESEVGGVAIFIPGALGGMITADNRTESGKDARTWEECVRIGELLADEALRIIADAPLQKNPSLHCMSRDLTLPVASPLMRMIIRNSPMAEHMGGLDEITTQMNVVTVGTAQMLSMPGEVLPNLGYYLKRNMPTDHVFLLGLTNDAFGYIMTKYDFNSFKRYEYISRTSLGEMTGEIFVEKALELVNDTPTPDNAP